MQLRFIVLVVTAAAGPVWLAAQASPVAKDTEGATGSVRYSPGPTGNEARFIVQEQLAGATLPSDAIGSTTAISGFIILDARGAVDTMVSQIRVDLTTLKSDQERRDRYIKRRTIGVDSFPTAVLRVKELRGFPTKLPATGAISFVVAGDLTIHGVTKPSLWEATATVNNGTISGRATTNFRFGDFGMERPRVMVVLSVADDIKLEYDFHFVAATGEP